MDGRLLPDFYEVRKMAEDPIEIERKWLVNEPPKISKRKKVTINQGVPGGQPEWN